MILSEEQVNTLRAHLASRSVDGWDQYDEAEQEAIARDLVEKVLPVLDALPANVNISALPHMQDFFRNAALEMLLANLRRLIINQNASDLTLLASLDETVLHQVALQLMSVTAVALDLLGPGPDLEPLLNSLVSWDPDEELRALLEE